ncbi:MAG: cyclic nucleotide-binding domain-containing protein [Planctomycetota bacterium]|nr:MAG: cyclic nucleotide-binding domain-containing protein [Planctomycetota bacterium]
MNLRAQTLEAIHPFRCLPPSLRAELAEELVEHAIAPGQPILRQGDASDRRVWLLARGRLEQVETYPRERPLGVLEAPRFFGERAALFDETRPVTVRALTAATCYSIEADRFLRLLKEDVAFAQALGDLLRDKRAIFAAFDRFRAELLHGVANGAISLKSLLPLYRALEPALHPGYAPDSEIDWSALSYAVRRLPANVTRTLTFFLTDELPERYAALAPSFRAVPTEARPRTVYEMLPGKSIVILRDGMSDLVDLVSCLCLYAVEARKIRRKLRGPGAIDALSRLPSDLSALASGGVVDAAGCADLRSLPFDVEELERLTSIWPEDTLQRVREIVVHHEDFGLEIKKQVHNYNSVHGERWTAQIAQATRALVGADPTELPAGLEVHVISSNTHSVANCLSSYWPAHAAEIERWARAERPALAAALAEPADLVYAAGREWLADDAARAKERRERDLGDGFVRLSESAFTGIQVDLVDLRRLAGRAIDPALPASQSGANALLVNIDFAFGQQAADVLGNLITLFGRRVRSINVLGKAGALVGRRGDLLVPDGFVEQGADGLLPLAHLQRIDVARLAARASGRAVHRGRLLTVAGTLLQNRRMLHFYRRIWDCVGLEMEGYSYARKIVDAQRLGMLRDDVDLRFLYYVSDVPLATAATLAERLDAGEGIPPLYAITREILCGILERAAALPPVRQAAR